MTNPAKKKAQQKAPEWLRHKERGSTFLLRLMRFLSLLVGRRLSRVVIYGIALYFFLAAPAARKTSREFLARCLDRPVTWLDIYRNILAFASTIHDRIYLLNDRYNIFNIRETGVDQLHASLAGNNGLFLFGSHLGSFEILRSHARNTPYLVSIAMYPDNARQLNSTLSAINPKAMQDIISLGQIDSMLEIHRKLKEGAMVGLLADRAVGPDQFITLPFLGSPARFPTGPFRMAAMLKHPVYFMSGLYRGGNRYDMHFELLTDYSEHSPTDRDAAVRDVLVKYVTALEHHCKSAPYNWFNFFDFWKAEG
jgi:predicted LPLAT superfamily acyltransferase